MPDRRSDNARAYRRLYQTARWQAIRSAHLASEPLCRFCSHLGIVTAATVVDHVVPHRGNPELFYGGPFQSLCAPCHDQAKAREDAAGFSDAIGTDGNPVDPRHPWNASAP